MMNNVNPGFKKIKFKKFIYFLCALMEFLAFFDILGEI